jgi:hypothetical protein
MVRDAMPKVFRFGERARPWGAKPGLREDDDEKGANESSTLDADEWREPRHTPGEARLLSRHHDSADILVGARGFLRDAAR